MTGPKRNKKGFSQHILVKITLVLTLSFGLAAVVTAGERGTTGADFLKIGLGAAAAGVGEAYTARSGDVNSVFYNPAGLADMEMNMLAATHLNWIAETRYEALAYARPILGVGTIGTSIFLLHMPEIPALDENGIPQGMVQAYDLGVQFSYARDLSSWLGLTGLSGGANMKILRRELAGSSASGLAADLGARYKLDDNFAFGLSCLNLGYLSEFESGSEKLPVVIRAGVSYAQDLGELHEIAAMVDLVQSLDNTLRSNFGLEYSFKNIVSLRSGYKLGYDTDGFQAGAGVQWQNLSLDYALKLMGVFGTTHLVSAGMGFGSSIKSLQQDRSQELLKEAEELYNRSKYDKALLIVDKAFAINAHDKRVINLRDKLRTVLEMLRMDVRPAGESKEQIKPGIDETLTPDEQEELRVPSSQEVAP